MLAVRSAALLRRAEAALWRPAKAGSWAKGVRHTRHVILQLAEVAVPEEMWVLASLTVAGCVLTCSSDTG